MSDSQNIRHTPLASSELSLWIPTGRSGFRLDRFEVLNWGTLHQRVWGLNCRGDNALLTGDIGSGKSTLVDGISTLLVAPNKITYNKAAGADARERTLRTYVLGQYKSERSEDGASARPIALRTNTSYSVILGRFVNEALGAEVTLAQVFWWKETQGQPARFYIIADEGLAIAQHFGEFGPSIDGLRKRLRSMRSVEMHDSFPPYAAAYRRRFGIETEQAMDLFYQTVSMKSVGNLTDFVRAHMLEPFPVEDRIAALIDHFDDLSRAHESVVKARRQIELLTPLVADCERHGAMGEEAKELRASRDMLKPWFAQLKHDLLQERLGRLGEQTRRVEERIASLFEACEAERARCGGIAEAIKANGGGRLEEIGRKIGEREREREQRAGKAEQYAALAREAGLPPDIDEASFSLNRLSLAAKIEENEDAQANAQNEVTEAAVSLRDLKLQFEVVTAELASLRSRRSNIPMRMLEIRERLCDAIECDEAELPFAGELIQVHPDASQWEGAIERLLHGFGISLLVSDEHHTSVTAWVDRNHLGGKLVHLRARAVERGTVRAPEPSTVAAKLQISPSSRHYPWLEARIAERFDHVCCRSIDELKQVDRGITRAGQIKGSPERFEKDDRRFVDDRTHYVLGWSNEGKIAALQRQADDLAHGGDTATKRVVAADTFQKTLRKRRTTLDQLKLFENFRELNWPEIAAEIDQLERERRELEATSDQLQMLREQEKEAQAALEKANRRHDGAKEERARLSERTEVATRERDACAVVLAATAPELCEAYFPRLEALRMRAPGETTLTVESCDERQHQMRDWLQTSIDAIDRKLRSLGENIVKAMKGYVDTYPIDAREVDCSLESAGEFAAMLDRLASDDLPRFEERFKSLLNENTIREVASFQSQLNRERQTIRERIDRINRSMRAINYNPGRYIRLEATNNPDIEIRDFQQQLKACTEGTLSGSADDAYSEAKFLEVKRIIERFRGREGSSEADRRWTRKVTDVRNWSEFSASERWRETDAEHEHYTDSGGKSGGQKEKLAYTVLAASLAYQFGLDTADVRPRTFRFVVIDEAFGRGSDESARYGLELFRTLDLQLLVVTPLQKIHIIEPYVASVGFVHNPDGRTSMLRNLTIEEYRAERAALRG
jgi:uncharacterized protein YPO0396